MEKSWIKKNPLDIGGKLFEKKSKKKAYEKLLITEKYSENNGGKKKHWVAKKNKL